MEPLETQSLPNTAPDATPVDRSTDSHGRSILSGFWQRPAWHWLLFASILTIGGFLSGRLFVPQAVSQTPITPAANRAQGRPQQPPRPVEVTALEAGRGVRSIQLLGQVEASEQATVRAQTSGVVQSILVQPGDRVSSGTPIAVLDDTDQQLALAEAQARLAQEQSDLARLEVGTRREIIAQRQAEVRSAQAREREAADNLKRTQELVQQGAFSQRSLVEAKTSVDEAHGARLAAAAALAEAQAGPIPEEIAAQRANVAAAQAAVNQAELAIERTQVRATSAGVVRSRQISPGDYVQSGGEIMTLVAGNRLDIFLELPEELSGRISPGMPIQLTARALPQWRESATITGVVPAADAASRRQRIRVRLDNPPATLLSGMAVTGSLNLPSNQPSFVITRDALVQRQDQWYVFRIAEGTAKQMAVDLVADMGESVAIYNPDLRVRESIVTRGADGLRDGMAIKVVGQ